MLLRAHHVRHFHQLSSRVVYAVTLAVYVKRLRRFNSELALGSFGQRVYRAVLKPHTHVNDLQPDHDSIQYLCSEWLV